MRLLYSQCFYFFIFEGPLQNDPYYHLILCSQTLVLIDERNTSHPLLSWRHFLTHNNAPVHLASLDVAVDSGIHMAACVNSSNVGFVYQLSTRVASQPVSFEFTRQLDDFSSDLVCDFNSLETYDKRYDRALTDRVVTQPVIGFSHLALPQNDSFMLLRVKK